MGEITRGYHPHPVFVVNTRKIIEQFHFLFQKRRGSYKSICYQLQKTAFGLSSVTIVVKVNDGPRFALSVFQLKPYSPT